jgi:hypothetical protein
VTPRDPLTNVSPGPSSGASIGTCSTRISSRRIGTVICTSSVTTYFTRRMRVAATRSVPTRSRSSLRTIPPSSADGWAVGVGVAVAEVVVPVVVVRGGMTSVSEVLTSDGGTGGGTGGISRVASAACRPPDDVTP